MAKLSRKWITSASLTILVAVVAVTTAPQWFPFVNVWVRGTISDQRPVLHGKTAVADAAEPHQQSSIVSLELSPQAMQNLGLTRKEIRPVRLSSFSRAITVPAMIVERAGLTHIEVATPMTGVITHVHAVQGEAVSPGTMLFRIRLTHEDLVKAQTDFLRTLGELDVETREVARLEKATADGVVREVELLEREYAKERLEAILSAQSEALRLHGLSDEQVEGIITNRRLLRELHVVAPSPHSQSEGKLRLSERPVHSVSFSSDGKNSPLSASSLTLQELRVHKGQSVAAGETLCVLNDLSKLYIEGLAFEQDVEQLSQAAHGTRPVSAVFGHNRDVPVTINNLTIAYLDNRIDEDSRTLRFYVRLPNKLIGQFENEQGQRFLGWKFRPGQRLQLKVPVETWSDQIVLPIDAVARDGAEFYVFRKLDKTTFERVAVHIVFRDQHSVVIRNDGSLRPGDVVPQRGAHQMQMAIRNKAGRGGHSHHGHVH